MRLVRTNVKRDYQRPVASMPRTFVQSNDWAGVERIVRDSFSSSSEDLNIFDVFFLVKDSFPHAASVIDFIVNALLFVEDISRASSKKQLACSVARYCRTLLGTRIEGIYEMLIEVSLDLWNDGLRVESFSTEKIFSSFRDYMSFRSSSLFKKVQHVMNFVLCLEVFQHLGLRPGKNEDDRFRFRNYARHLREHPCLFAHDFIISTIDLVQDILTKGVAYFTTGNIDALVCNTNTVSEWVNSCRDLEERYHRPDFSFTSVQDFRLELSKLLDTSDLLKKSMNIYSTAERDLIRRYSANLQGIEAKLLVNDKALRMRSMPFGVYLVGGSSIGKTYLSNVLQHAFGSFANMHGLELPGGAEYCYSRNHRDEFWSMYKPYMWSIVIDEIADKLLTPSLEDESVAEILQILNPAPYVTNQAELEKKGNVPLDAKFILATGNSRECGITALQRNPFAFWRRFQFRVTPIPKDAHSIEASGCRILSPDLSLSDHLDGYDDFWTFVVEEPKPYQQDFKSREPTQLVRWQHVATFESIDDFLSWYSGKIHDHIEKNRIMLNANDRVYETKICSDCKRSRCNCITRVDDVVVQSPGLGHRPLPWPAYLAAIFFMSLFYIIARCADLGVYLINWALRSTQAPPCRVEGWFDYCVRHRDVLLLKARNYLEDWILRVGGYRIHYKYLGIRVAYVLVSTLGILASVRLIYRNIRKIRVDGAEFTRPKPKDETKYDNFWKNDDPALCTLDLSPLITSWKALSPRDIGDKLSREVWSALFKSNGAQQIGHAVRVCGQIFVTNYHYFTELPIERVCLFQQNTKGVVPRKEFRFDKDLCFIDEEHDLIFFRHPELPTGRGISDFLVDAKLQKPITCEMISRDRDGDIILRRLNSARYDTINIRNIKFSGVVDSLVSKPDITTVEGDCGSLVWSKLGAGPIVCGLHIASTADGHCITLRLSKSQWLNAKKFFDPQSFISSANPRMMEKAGGLKKELHHKSPFRFIETGSASVFGSFGTFRPIPTKSKVARTLYSKQFVEATKDSDFPLSDAFGPPHLRSYHVRRNPLLHTVNTNENIDHAILERCGDAIFNDILAGTPSGEFELLEPYDSFTGLNGCPDVRYVDRIKIRTSAGHPYYRSKLPHIVQLGKIGNVDEAIDMTPEIAQQVDDILERYRAGQRDGMVFCAHMKDEAVSQKNIDKMKTRIFSGAPLANTIVMRMLLLSFIRVMQRNRFIFEAAPGMVAQSSEWNSLSEYLTEHGSDRVVAGDYSKFDKTMSASVILMAFKVIRRICSLGSYTEEELTMIDAIAMDIAFPYTNYFGDFVEFYGTNPSGHPLTVVINSIVNSLYIRYAYVTTNPERELDTFKQNVNLMTYGDDNIMNVSERASFFNHTTISEALADIGVVYTMADKEATSVPYIDIKNASFLKRGFRYDDALKAVVCPLDHDSISKMLTWCLVTKDFDAREQMLSSVSCALGEYFWYGREIFEDRSKAFKDFLYRIDGGPFESHVFPTWDSLVDRYNGVSKRAKRPGSRFLNFDIQGKRRRRKTFLSEAFKVLETTALMYLLNPYLWYQLFMILDNPHSTPRVHLRRLWRRIRSFIQVVRRYGNDFWESFRSANWDFQVRDECRLDLLRQLPDDLLSVVFDMLNEFNVSRLINGVNLDFDLTSLLRELRSHRDRIITVQSSVWFDVWADCIRPRRRKNRKFIKQNKNELQFLKEKDLIHLKKDAEPRQVRVESLSFPVGCVRELTPPKKALTMVEASGDKSNDATSGHSDNSRPDDVVPQAPVDVDRTHTQVEEIMDFREDTPSADVQFASVSDPTFTGDAIDVGSIATFLQRPVKIHEYTWTEGAPQPLSTIEPWFLFFNNATIKKKVDNYGLVCCNLHLKVVINASPFYYGSLWASYQPKHLFGNSIDAPEPLSHIAYSQRPHINILPQNNQGGEMVLPFFHEKNWLELTSIFELASMGRLSIFEAIPLQNSNGVSGGIVNVQFYAWATDVKMSAPTVSLAVQSGSPEVIDEYGRGPVSRVASGIAYVASMLKVVPSISPFATATEIGASAISQVASIFGYTDVPVISSVEPVKNMPFQSLTSAGIGEPVTKLTLDPKNELSIDPRTVGLTGGDELSTRYLVQRESLLSIINWSNTAASDELLYSCPVFPTLYGRETGTGQNIVQLVPMAMVAQLFEHWRGDVIFRFKVICSQYHRGRIRITWDPIGDIVSTSDTTTTSFNKIVDISPDVDVEVRCKYSQARHWLTNIDIEPVSGFTFQRVPGEAFTNFASSKNSNGSITVRVLNELSSPVATSSVQIMVFVRGCGETMQFMNPKNRFTTKSSYYTVQSGNWISPSDCEEMANEPSSDCPGAYRVYGGEAVGSLRALMRRAYYEPFISYYPWSNLTQPNIQIFRTRARKYPKQPGYSPRAAMAAANQLGTGESPANFTTFKPFTLIAPCFAGHRGSMIWHYNLDTTSARTQQVSRFTAERSMQGVNTDGSGRLVETESVELTTSFVGLVTQNLYSAFYQDAVGSCSEGYALTNTTTQTGLSVSYPHYYPLRFNGTSLKDWETGSVLDDTNAQSTLVSFELRPARSGSNAGSSNAYAKTQPEDFVLNRFCSIGTDYTPFFFLNVPTLFVYGDELQAAAL